MVVSPQEPRKSRTLSISSIAPNCEPIRISSKPNCSIDLAERPESTDLAKVASVNFICPPEEARRRIKRVADLGFEEILIGSQFDAIEEIERVRDFLDS